MVSVHTIHPHIPAHRKTKKRRKKGRKKGRKDGRKNEGRKEGKEEIREKKSPIVSIFFFTEGEMHPDFQEATGAWDLWHLGSETFLTMMIYRLLSQSLPFRNQSSEITY